MAVHGRFRQPCPDCGAPVQRIRYASGETNYCARCQTDGRVLADSQALEQTLMNLLDNAIKYAPDGGKIRISSFSQGDRVRISVQDDGPGIPEKHRPFLFQRFYRVDPGRSRDIGGTGLGLSIVKTLVESMSGEVGMEPAAETGSIFWVTLPQY
jgi:two-component system phosphate regulon sensor histidine kinase PhoR